MSMQPARFKNDALGFDSFDGFTKGESWNGWDCPYFTFEQAQIVLRTYNELRTIIGERQGYYNSESDAFIFPTKEDVEVFKFYAENNQKYYPIGAFTWIWEETEKDLPTS